MAGGLYKRLKTWGLTEVPTNTQLNAEFDNVKNNFIAQMIASYSQSITQSNKQTAPGITGAEALPTALSGDLENIRYQLNAIIGDAGGLWRATPAINLSQLNTISNPGGVPQNRIISGRVASTTAQPMFLTPNGASNGVNLKAASTNLVAYINNSQYKLSADIALTGLTSAPSSNNTCLLDSSIYDGASQYTLNAGDYLANGSGFNITQTDVSGKFLYHGNFDEFPLLVRTMGSNISALVGSYAAFSYVHGAGTKEYFIGFVASSTQITKCFRGFFFDSSDNPIVPQLLSVNDTVTLLQLTWVYLKNDGTLAVSYTNPRYSGTQPATPSIGDRWYDLVNQQWKSWSGSAWTATSDILVGVCAQDSSGNTVAARSFDTFRAYGDLCTATPEWYSTTEFRSKFPYSKINSYGTTFIQDKDFVRWTTLDFDSGVTQAASTTYFLYITETGKPKISNIVPHRRFDLAGFYHQSKPWRAVAMIYSNGSTLFDQFAISPLGQINGDFINDRTLSISKRRGAAITTCFANSPTFYAPVDNYAASLTAKAQTTSSTSFVDIQDSNSTTLQANITTSGRPTLVLVQMNGLNVNAQAGTDARATISLKRDGSSIALPVIGANVVPNNTVMYAPLQYVFIDSSLSAGQHTYTLQVKASNAAALISIDSGTSIQALEI